jgi:signal transduction histidine kinase
MKLLNYTSSWFLFILFLILLVWAGSFYVIMLDEIYDSMDDGLDNQKSLIIQKADLDSSILQRTAFDEGNFLVKEIPLQNAIDYTDHYKDTLMYMQNEQDFEPVRMLITAFETKGKTYEMRVITSMVEEDDLIEDLLYSLLFLFLGLAATLLLLNNFLLKKIWQPFYQVLERLQRFRLDDPQPIVSSSSPIEEFRLLDASVNKLLTRNIQAYEDQKQFIENASHELQTPLAISLNKLELLAGHPLQEEPLVLVGSVMDNLERLIRLNKSLLLLTRINNQQYTTEDEVNFNGTIRKLLEDFKDQASYKEVGLFLEEHGQCIVNLNPELAQILIVNLLKNAIVHNRPGGFVKVMVREKSIEIQNSGTSEPLDASKIFERFYKNEASGSSTGLGLSIVKAITDLYGFNIQYRFEEKHVFRLEM